MLEEFCNAHETARAARVAVSVMKRQVNELREALCKTGLEIAQMEWMHDATLTPSYSSRVMFQKFLGVDDSLHPIVLNLSRPNMLESLQSAVSKIARSIESLQACERNSLTAEGQLERAMGWACGGPNSSATGNGSSKTSGIPPEFHDHLTRRRRLLWQAREKASDIIKVCMSILEFEASRDGLFRSPGEIYPTRTGADGRTWQQAYLNALQRLDITYHSFARTEQEWKLAQSTMETASSGLSSATNELSIASLKAKSASGELQRTVLAMRDCACEASVALMAYAGVSNRHSTLTSECGFMLEEVLAITEDLHDVHSLGKEAATVHCSLVEDLSKANAILLPLETVLSKDVAAMTDAMWRLARPYPLVPSLTSSVKGLYSMLTRLARTASLHAGNLHKALEGLGESQEVESPVTDVSRLDVAAGFDDKARENLSMSNGESTKDFVGIGLPLEAKGWLSPPDSICSSSTDSGITLAEMSLPDSFNDQEDIGQPLLHGSGSKDATDFQNTTPHSQTASREILDSPHRSKYTEADNTPIGSFKSTPSDPNEYPLAVASPSDESIIVCPDTSHPSNENRDVMSGGKDEISSLNKVIIKDETRDATHTSSRVGRGRNPYAMSVLRRVEMKLDGRDISDNREISWTPWI
ncbi:hypothetical protein M0R45_001825 [Rubus argutus]|uniref:Uncharacterized protein n=1 Tax=Rubus argutus TaxID=59490 RepID=A0AAW1VFP0_RUBAR